MPRLIETKEPIPEYSTVINWTVPVYIKNGEDYYKVCFDIKRKPLSDGTLELTKEEIKTIEEMSGIYFIEKIAYTLGKIRIKSEYNLHLLSNVKAIAYLLERFELIKED